MKNKLTKYTQTFFYFLLISLPRFIRRRKKISYPMIAVLVLALISAGTFFYIQKQKGLVNLANLNVAQAEELKNSVFEKNLEIFRFMDEKGEKKQTGTVRLTTFDEKDSGSKETFFDFDQDYQKGYKFIQGDREIKIIPKNVSGILYDRKIAGKAGLKNGDKVTSGQFLSYQEKTGSNFFLSGKGDNHIFSLSRDNNTLKQWSVYDKYRENITEEWEFQGAILKKNDDGSIDVFRMPVKEDSQKTMQNLDNDMAQRIANTLKEEMGDDYYFHPQNYLFHIPKAYFVTAGGETKDAEVSVENENILKIQIQAQKQEFPLILDPTITLATKMNYRQFNGDTGSDQFGYSVSGAGDVNGDGLDDVIVGAYGDDDTGSASGSAFIFYGTKVTSGTLAGTNGANVKITGDAAGDNFGYSVSDAGDMNGDGLDDVIVGAYWDDDGGDASGSVFIFYGGVTLVSGTASQIANVKIIGDSATDIFGTSVASAGDVNGDGKSDVIVGASLDDDGGDASGSVFIFYGGVTSGTASSVANIKITGDTADDRFGGYISGAGDVNGDGKDDVIVGAILDDDGGDASGSVFIFYGGVTSGTASSVANIKITGDMAGDYFGYSVSGAGDVNGDGKDDVIVGTMKARLGTGTTAGAAYIFYGGVVSGTASSVANVYITGDNADDDFGSSVSSAGDINGDGKDDVIVGAQRDDDGYGGSGSAFIYYGGSMVSGSATQRSNIKITGPSTNAYLGCSVSDAGDTNGDGKADIIVGAYNATGQASSSGTARVYTFNDFQNEVKITGDMAGDHFGSSVSSAGDVNGDGKDDVIVGTSYAKLGVGTTVGAAYIFYGGISSGSASSHADVKITGDSGNDSFGESVSGAGDVNGDGLDDVIVGAYRDDDGGTDAGSAFIFYGGVTSGEASARANVKITGDAPYDYFGRAVSDAGDVNGDGKDDVIVGAYQAPYSGGEEGPGTAYIFYGGVTSGSATAKADIKLVGDNANDYFGVSVSSAGDMNGDGKDDIVVGASEDDDNGNGSGSVYIFYGGVSSGVATTKANVKLTGESADDYFGTSVSSAGDINGDGKDDVIAGASSYASNGAAYIFYGGVTSGLAASKYNVRLTGDSGLDYFGDSVSGAGDVNGDGKDDVIVGAYADDDNGNGSGSAFIFYGGVTSGVATTKANIKLVGDDASDQFGWSTSGAGDVNGDGKDDVIVGAYGDDDGGDASGSAFIFSLGPSGQVQKVNGESAGDSFGYSVANAGDMDGDGKDDVVVGSVGIGSSAGAAYIFLGSKISGTAAIGADIKITGDAAGDKFGSSVSGAGDINLDGKDDIIVGAPGTNSGAGSAFIFYGGVTSGTASSVDNVTITGDSSGDGFGTSVSHAGDINLDGKADVIVGAPNDDDGGDGSGSAFIIYGTAASGAATTVANVKITGDAGSDGFGTSVSGAGDMNNDGKSDIIVGAPGTSSGAGSAFIFYGGVTSGAASAVDNATITGDSASDSLGNSVSGAGDVNLDGKDDVVVGAPGDDDTGDSSGSAFIIYGSAASGVASTVANVKLTGDSASDQFGYSVANAGDINGDHKADILVGAPYDDDNGSNSGSVMVFYGGVVSGTASAKVDAKILGDSADDNFGYSVAGGGDVNTDGKADIIVGATGDDDGGDASGSVKIITDLATKDNPDSPNFRLDGDSTSEYFGYAVSSAGDVNGDGLDDVIVGAYLDDDAGFNSGSAFIFYGGIAAGAATAQADIKLTGQTANDQFGKSVSGAGDVNGDGLDDVIVGADQYSSGNGVAYIFYGGVTSGPAASRYNIRITGDAGGNTWFGQSVSGAGDINADGKDDVIVGAFNKAYIFYGGLTTSGAASTRTKAVILTADDQYDRFGISVSGAGDVNGDGKDDVVVGASDDSMDGNSSAYIFYGGVISGSASSKAGVKITNDTAWDQFGESVSGAGDVNGDGKDDVIVGAPHSFNNGATYIFYGGVLSGTASSVANVIEIGDFSSDHFGNSVSGAGDVNGDGLDDVVIGASGDDDNGSGSGSVFVFYGGSLTSGTASDVADVKIIGDSSGDYFGSSVSGAGDVNGDGLDDVIVGAKEDDDGGDASGSAKIIYGHRISTDMPTAMTPASGSYNHDSPTASLSCTGGTYNTWQDKYGNTVTADMEAWYDGKWHSVANDDADGSFSWDMSNIAMQSGIDLRCRNDISGTTGGFSRWYYPYSDLTMIQGAEKIRGDVKLRGDVKFR